MAKIDDSKNLLTWIRLLNEQTEWNSLTDAGLWLGNIMGKKLEASESALADFWSALTLMRTIIYDLHFGRQPDFAPLNDRLANVSFAFHETGNRSHNLLLPIFRAKVEGQGDSALLEMITNTTLFEFGHDVARYKISPKEFEVARCEGLYRDAKLHRLSAAPDIDDALEVEWRKEVEVLRENDPLQADDILRCADFFIASSRSRFCSSACRTNTFQIVKQLQDPVYLAEKQRRYRLKNRK